MRLDIRPLFRMIYSFCWEQASLRSLQHELRTPDGSTLSSKSFVDYHSFFREICWLDNERQPKIGGPGTVVEIDETAFSKRKYNRGKRMAAQQWVFGGVERGDKTKLFAIPVAQRDANTLLPLIAHYIAPGTEIQSDCWAVAMSPITLFSKINRVKLELFLDLPMTHIVAHLRACRLLRSSVSCSKCNVPCVEYQKVTPSWPGCGWRCPSCYCN
ncbi:hypothetical protein PRIPAC_73404 [Pristionchus pacificus]|uniref:DDE_Tnp_IS1595 domain-containing protein n=1 Tax=Pristionchus pacificus TaxID=54126 RepID=A0A2A6CRN2_PRIPA|nr:hypothetical protein PRIPAC_73404 [Pristionchus pacificus]|eukprot:PDM80872.1 hypothetical protein PRIPAC_35875 [Pristionchus pacificus]